MLFITIVKQYYQDQKILECGMLWEVAIKKWEKIIKHKDVMLEHKIQRTEKELLFIKWVNYII
jgi:hypothetical protein